MQHVLDQQADLQLRQGVASRDKQKSILHDVRQKSDLPAP